MSNKQPPRARLLLVDDDRNLLESMGDWLRGRGFVVDEAATVAIACRMLERERFDAAVVDLRLNDGDGFDVLAVARRVQPECSVLLMTGYGTVETGIEALRAGAFDLLTKPLIDQELELALDRALRQKKVLEENHSLRAQLDERFGLENIVGHDVRMTRLFEVMQSVADTRATILITGESGTGKSLVARAIHRLSNRRDRPFVEVACGALPETLLESELFGHVQGSFTGATGNKVGKFAQADGGTLFLDEIGTASAALQVKLLRVLQEFQFEPVGGTQTISVDTRVVLATNENLEQAVADGRFRQDLFYRINVINLELPPLRERISDIPSLAEHFLKQVAREAGKAVDGFDADAMSAMQQYRWPGNVRELQNVVERAVLLGRDRQVRLTDLPTHLTRGVPVATGPRPPVSLTLREALEGPERQIILQSLKEHGWNRNATAESLGINRTTLYKKMKRLGLECPHGVF
ncbi:MAG TPA: sigma-54-dependent Fis family transcriptional regulator [Planctomycetaceae bacterium]|nr:sigma-54-dependent Fis family transcriptional regulator [Planctomycetaceae bacterium]HRF00011.1 sigma-54 dependent transcriptional regulator [Pirellulaceae bacterium]